MTAYVNNRVTSVPARLTNYGRTHIANVRRLFRARFGHELRTLLASAEFTESVA